MNFWTRKFSDENKTLHQSLIFISKLLLVVALYSLVMYLDTNVFQAAFAQIIAYILDSTGYQPVIQGYSIIISGTEYIITQKSLGLTSIAAFIALIYTSTSQIFENLNTILQGLVILITANIIRLYTIIVFTERNILKFNLIYKALLEWSLIIISVLLWVYWLKNIKNKQPVYQRKIKETVTKLRQNQEKTK